MFGVETSLKVKNSQEYGARDFSKATLVVASLNCCNSAYHVEEFGSGNTLHLATRVLQLAQRPTTWYLISCFHLSCYVSLPHDRS